MHNGQTDSGGRAGLARLAAAARDGDGSSRDRLLAAARPLMVRWARHLVDDAATAEDVAQDALVEADRTLTSLRAPGAVTGWLYLIVRKHADRHRRQRPAWLLEGNATGSAVADWPESCESEPDAGHAENRAAIRTALALATDADRLLLVLRYYGGWPQSDLAALLGITVGAVRKRLHDARRRLAAGLGSVPPAVTAADPWEKFMSEVRGLLGAAYDLDDPLPGLPPGRPPLSRPAAPGRLETGIKVIDALAPLPRGGIADLTGRAGSGHLALVAEILHNLAGAGPAALVAVSSAPSSAGLSARLWKLLDPPAPAAALTAVITVPPERGAQAADQAARLAGWLAHGDATVLLVLDEPTARIAGPDGLGAAVGTCASGPGSVTGLRVAPHPAGHAPAGPWPGADAEIRTAETEMIAGRLPAIDVLASWSALLDGDILPAADRAAARQARDLLARAARLRDYLTQPLRIAEPATGVPGQAVPARDAVAGLTRLLEQPA